MTKDTTKDHGPYLAVGPYCWGRGQTVQEAIKRARRNLPSMATVKRGAPCFRVWNHAAHATVTWDGAIEWETDVKPEPVRVGDFTRTGKPVAA